MNDGKLLKTTDLAERWQVSEETLRKWRKENQGPVFVKFNGTIRYRIEDVVEYEKKNRINN